MNEYVIASCAQPSLIVRGEKLLDRITEAGDYRFVAYLHHGVPPYLVLQKFDSTGFSKYLVIEINRTGLTSEQRESLQRFQYLKSHKNKVADPAYLEFLEELGELIMKDKNWVYLSPAGYLAWAMEQADTNT